MHGVVSLLPEQYYHQVERIWAELQQEFSVSGVYITPYPHFSYQVALLYDLDKVASVLERIARNITTFQVRTTGIGIFNGVSPVIYIPVVRSLELSQLHEELWNELSIAGSGIQEYYSPAQWMPHITIGFGDIGRDNLPAIVQWLIEHDFTWEFTVNNLGFIHDTGIRQELHSRYDIRDKPAPGKSSMEMLNRRPLTPDILEDLLKLHEQVKRESGGTIFEDSTEAIRRMREERTEYLMQLHTPSLDETSP